jgi:hypothetical protein
VTVLQWGFEARKLADPASFAALKSASSRHHDDIADIRLTRGVRKPVGE